MYNGQTVRYYFSSQPEWTLALKSQFDNEVSKWKDLKTLGTTNGLPGASIFLPTKVGGPEPGAFEIRIDSNPAGSTSCNESPGPKFIRYNPNDPDVLYVIRHEMGHAFGLRHAGYIDSLTTPTGVLEDGVTRSLMGFCGRPQNGSSTPRSDDWAAVWRNVAGGLPTSPDARTVVVDGGFETVAFEAWARTGATARDADFSYTGDRSMKLSPSGVIEQRVRVTNPSSTSSASIRYKSNAGSSATFKAGVKPLQYSAILPSSCDYYNEAPYLNHRWNVPIHSPMNNNFAWYQSSVLQTTTNWQWTSATATMPPPAILPEAWDLDIRITNEPTSPGFIWLDDIRMTN